MQKFAILGCVISVLFLSNAYAQVPRLVHYQGELKNEDGTAMNGTVNLDFAIYKSPMADTPLWSEIHKNVGISEGKYEVMLGSQNPLNLSYYEYFLDVRQSGQESRQPRVRIVGSGYNFRLWFLFAVYTVVWLGLSGYLFSISQRQKKLILDLQALAGLKSSQAS